MRLLPVAALLLTGLVASCAPAPTQAPAPAPQTAASTPARSCVELARISEARVVNDRTIDFHLRDGSVLRNTLPNACPSLGIEKAFTYSTSLSRLCSTDIITVIHTGGGPRTGASCGLGSFAAVAPTAAPATN
jgi:hypothetical protein